MVVVVVVVVVLVAVVGLGGGNGDGGGGGGDNSGPTSGDSGPTSGDSGLVMAVMAELMKIPTYSNFYLPLLCCEVKGRHGHSTGCHSNQNQWAC